MPVAAHGRTDAGSRGLLSFCLGGTYVQPSGAPALSMKGGVGKTTTAIGLARALQRRGRKTAILDVDVHGGALPRALHLARDPGYEPLVGARLRTGTEEGYQRAISEDRYREGMARFWGVSPERVRSEVMQAWQGAEEGASRNWNSEFDQHPDRVRNADKWLQAARAGIQR